MTHRHDRRTFLKTTGAAGLTLLCPATVRPAAPSPLFKISLAQWSHHRAIRAAEMDPFDFPKSSRTVYGIDAIEYVSVFYRETVQGGRFAREMKTRTDGEGVSSLLIMVDGEGALGDADEKKRLQAVDNHRKWLDAARELGCHSIRVNAQSSGSWTEQRDRAADGLHRLCLLGEEAGLYVLVENHGGLSSNGRWLAETIRKADHPRCGTLPDFGNFRVRDDEWYDRYIGVADLMPFARAVSAKSHEFDEAGDEVRTDYRKMLGIVLGHGYRGHVGIEYEGAKHSEREGILLTKRLLERIRVEMEKR